VSAVNTVYYTAMKIHNNLPLQLRLEANTNIFLQKLKQILILKRYYNLNEYYDDRFNELQS
jgi:hypothetical protein